MSILQIQRNYLLTLTIVSCCSISLANAQPPDERGGRRGGPPPEAAEACVEQTEGAACSFSGRRGDVEGVCIILPEGEEQLVCAPQREIPDQRTEDDQHGD